MRTEHFIVSCAGGITPKSRAKVCAQWRILKSVSLLLTVLRRWIWYNSYSNVIKSMCFMSFFVFWCKLFIRKLPGIVKRELFFLLSFTCNYVVSVPRVFFFLFVLGIGCAILL